MEFTMSNWIQLAILLSTLAAGYGALKQRIEFLTESMRLLREQLEKLEKNQSDHNKNMVRLATLENTVLTSNLVARTTELEREVVQLKSEVKQNLHRIEVIEEA